MTDPRPSWRDVTVASGDLSLAVRDFCGDGPSVLLLHGAGRSLADWMLVAPELRDAYRVVAMDLRGHGHSTDGPWTWASALSDIDAVVSASELVSPTVVGHSRGGMLAAMWAASRDACRAAINIDGHGYGRPQDVVGIAPDVVRERQQVLHQVSRQHLRQQAQPVPVEVFAQRLDVYQQAARKAGIPDALLDEAINRMRVLDGNEGYMRPLEQTLIDMETLLEDCDLIEVYERVSIPLLIVQTAAQTSLSAELGIDWVDSFLIAQDRGISTALRRLSDEHDNIEFRHVDADHDLLIRKPQLTTELIRDFIASLPSKQ